MGDEELVIRVNLDAMTIGDLETIEKPETLSELIDIFARTVTGIEDVRKLPVKRLRDIGLAILAEIKALQAQKN